MNMDLALIAGFGACLLLSAFFSASETALTSLPTAKAHRLLMLNGGKKGRFRTLWLWIDKPDVVLATILVCNNLVNTLCAAIATVLAQRVFDSYALGIATGVATLAILLVGEVSPKIFAKHNAERLAPSAMRVLAPIHIVVSPVTRFLAWPATRLSSLREGAASTAKLMQMQPEPVRLMHPAGERNVLQTFSVRWAMTPRSHMCCLQKSTSLDTIAKHVQQCECTRCPVYDKTLDDIVGVFHVKDLIPPLSAGQNSLFHLKDYIRPVLFVSEEVTINSLLKKFQQTRTHLAIVVDASRKTVGAIQLEDALAKLVEEQANAVD